MVELKLSNLITGAGTGARILDPRVSRVLTAANDLKSSHSGNIGFMHGIMCMTFLPYRDQSNVVRHWESVNGHTAMRVEAGSAYDAAAERWVPLPIPYGKTSRLMLIHLCTQAVRRQSPVVRTNGSMTKFLKTVVKRPVNSNDIAGFKIQISALSAATVRLATKRKQSNSHLVSEFDLQWLESPAHRVLWPSKIILSDEFWEGLRSRAVPIDLDAISAISHSALAIDVYLWLAHRLRRINSPYTVYWTVLWKQFGHGYSRLRDFRRKFLITLRQVTAVYPAAKIEEAISEDGVSIGLKLYRSPPPIPDN